MKELDITPITNTAQMPIKKGTLQFLQDINTENFQDIIAALRGSNAYTLAPVVLWGCVNSGSGLVYNISEGAVIFLGKIYKVAAASFTAPGGQVAVFSVTTTQYTTNADPVTFTDGTVHNVHNIKAISIVAGVAGAYLYSDFVFYPFGIQQAIAVETNRATTAEGTLNALITDINSAWTLRNNIADVIVFGGTGTAVTLCNIKYKVIGKTMIVAWKATITNTTAPDNFTILIPASKNFNGGFDFRSSCIIFDGGGAKAGVSWLSMLAPTKIQVDPAAAVGLTNGAAAELAGSVTFEIA